MNIHTTCKMNEQIKINLVDGKKNGLMQAKELTKGKAHDTSITDTQTNKFEL